MGLPKYTAIEDLKTEAQMNSTKECAEVQNIAQLEQLERTKQDHRFLAIIVHNMRRRPPEKSQPP